MNIKRLIGIAAVAVALIAGVNYAFSEDAPQCKIGPVSVIQELIDAGAIAGTISQGEVDHLTAEKGLPPGAEGKPFSIIRVDMNDFSALMVIQGDCINDKVGPVPSQLIDNVLGSVKASG